MKVRHGFVSNSSSSSFIVALPQEPKNRDELKEMLFGKDDGAISIYDYDPISFWTIACKVWDGVQTAKEKKGKKDKLDYKYASPNICNLAVLTEAFSGRYYYQVNSYTIGSKDEFGGSWYEKIGEFFGSDKKLLNSLRDAFIKQEKINTKQREERNALEKELGPAFVPWADKDGKDREGKPYSKEAIAAYKKYCDEHDAYLKSKEYEAMVKRHRKEYAPIEKEVDRLTDLLAKADAKAFLKKHKGSFVFIVDYSDNDGESTYEHGDIFHNVPHIKISHH